MKHCQTAGVRDGVACGAPATHRVTAGCVHEHIRRGWACGEHGALIEAGVINCAECHKSEHSHRCPLLARVEPIGATS